MGSAVPSAAEAPGEQLDWQVINAEGEFQASERLRDAARVMSEEPIAIQLR